MTHEASERTSASDSLYRAVWRWHFYAGLQVLPILIWLAITGGLYFFKAEIDGFFHRDLKPCPTGFMRPAEPLSLLVVAQPPGSANLARISGRKEHIACAHC